MRNFIKYNPSLSQECVYLKFITKQHSATEEVLHKIHNYKSCVDCITLTLMSQSVNTHTRMHACTHARTHARTHATHARTHKHTQSIQPHDKHYTKVTRSNDPPPALIIQVAPLHKSVRMPSTVSFQSPLVIHYIQHLLTHVVDMSIVITVGV